MGLCKCPKRQVTTQFCFEHRVNVCENCMVVNHTKCTVQSYIQWLKDSDFDSSCTLCGTLLDDEDCVRLICYHVFHWECLNSRQQALPSNTAPGGHTCPTCNDPIFPPSNLVSPVADVLRTRLGQVNWARNALELPLLQEDGAASSYSKFNATQSISSKDVVNTFSANSTQNRITHPSNNGDGEVSESPHSILNMEKVLSNANASDYPATSRRPLLHRESPIGGSDRDDKKYQRKSVPALFSRWSRRFYAPSSKPPWRRTWFYVLVGVVGFICVIYVMATVGRRSPDGEISFIYNKNLPHEE